MSTHKCISICTLMCLYIFTYLHTFTYMMYLHTFSQKFVIAYIAWVTIVSHFSFVEKLHCFYFFVFIKIVIVFKGKPLFTYPLFFRVNSRNGHPDQRLSRCLPLVHVAKHCSRKIIICIALFLGFYLITQINIISEEGPYFSRTRQYVPIITINVKLPKQLILKSICYSFCSVLHLRRKYACHSWNAK